MTIFRRNSVNKTGTRAGKNAVSFSDQLKVVVFERYRSDGAKYDSGEVGSLDLLKDCKCSKKSSPDGILKLHPKYSICKSDKEDRWIVEIDKNCALVCQSNEGSSGENDYTMNTPHLPCRKLTPEDFHDGSSSSSFLEDNPNCFGMIQETEIRPCSMDSLERNERSIDDSLDELFSLHSISGIIPSPPRLPQRKETISSSSIRSTSLSSKDSASTKNGIGIMAPRPPLRKESTSSSSLSVGEATRPNNGMNPFAPRQPQRKESISSFTLGGSSSNLLGTSMNSVLGASMSSIPEQTEVVRLLSESNSTFGTMNSIPEETEVLHLPPLLNQQPQKERPLRENTKAALSAPNLPQRKDSITSCSSNESTQSKPVKLQASPQPPHRKASISSFILSESSSTLGVSTSFIPEQTEVVRRLAESSSTFGTMSSIPEQNELLYLPALPTDKIEREQPMKDGLLPPHQLQRKESITGKTGVALLPPQQPQRQESFLQSS